MPKNLVFCLGLLICMPSLAMGPQFSPPDSVRPPARDTFYAPPGALLDDNGPCMRYCFTLMSRLQSETNRSAYAKCRAQCQSSVQ